MSQQYLRKVGLLVSTGERGLDLSNMHIIFRVWAMDSDRPPTAIIRIFNLSQDSSKRIAEEFESVKLQAGYENGDFGVIFQGTIKQTHRGRIDAKDTFLDIYAADGDWWRAFGHINTSVAAGSTNEERIKAVLSTAPAYNVQEGEITIPLSAGTGGTLPRGKVLFGLSWYHLNQQALSTNTTWFVQDGKVNFVNRTSYLEGEIVKINSETGMIGVPEATIEGIEVKCLLKPTIKVGRRVQIDNKSINTLSPIRSPDTGGFPTFRSPISFPASVTSDGIYRVLVAEHRGDSRGSEGSEWFTDLTCLALDASADPQQAVQPG